MAGKQVNFEVNVDAADAISDFKKVGKEAERAGKAIEKGLEVRPDTGKIDKFISNLKEAADEAENVGKAVQSIKKFAPEVDDSELAQMVLALRKAGVEFDALEAKAKELGDAVKQVDSTKLKDVDTNSRTAAAGADQLTRSVGGSRSVLANMVGNATQDLGALGGVAGSAGVAFGQMGEYMADARLEGEGMGSVLKNFGAVVGPVAALSIGIGLAAKAVGAFKASQAEMAENIRQTTEAFEDGVGSIDDWHDAITDAFSSGTATDAEAFSQQIANALESALEPKDFNELRTNMADLGLTFQDLGTLAGTAAQDFVAWADGQLAASGATAQVRNELAPLIDELGNAEQILADLRAREGMGELDLGPTIAFVEGNKDLINSLGEVQEGFDDLNIEESAQQFLQLEASVNPAARAMVNAAVNANTAADGTTNYTAALAEFISARNDANAAEREAAEQAEYRQQFLEGNVAAQEAATAAEKERVAAMLEANAAAKEASLELGSASSRAEAFAAAMEQTATAIRRANTDQIISFVDNMHGMGDALDEAADSGVSFAEVDIVPDTWDEVLAMPEELRPVVDAIGQFGEDISGRLTDAFATGGAGGVRAAAAEATQAVTDEINAMSISAEEKTALIKQALTELGLTDVQIKATIELAGEEQARQALDIFASDIENLPEGAEFEVKTLMANGQFIEALEELNAARLEQGQSPIVIPGIYNPEQADADIKAWREKEEAEGVTLATDADVLPATRKVADWVSDTEKSDGATVDVDADPAGAESTTEAWRTRPRTAGINLSILQLLVTEALLQAVTRPRTAPITADLRGEDEAERQLNNVARRRDAYIYTHTVNTGGTTAGTTGGPTGDTLMAPAAMAGPALMSGEDEELGVAPLVGATVSSVPSSGVAVVSTAPASVVNNMQVTVQAAVIGNRHEVERTVAKALRSYTRLNGSRN